jgi:hypothetical protein
MICPVHRVVDAMNVIGSRPDGWWRDRPGAIDRLVAQLDRWAEVRGERVTVMLEGPPRREPATVRVAVEWAPSAGANSADGEIVRRLPEWLAEALAAAGESESAKPAGSEVDADRPGVVVVTSDRDLAARVRDAGAEVEPSRRFRATLDAL